MAISYKQMLNLYRIYGRLSKDPEPKYTKNGKMHWKFSVPIGQNESTEWINCSVFKEELHPVIEKLKKGDTIKFLAYHHVTTLDDGRRFQNYDVTEIENVYILDPTQCTGRPKKEKVENVKPDPWEQSPLDLGDF